MEYFIWFLFFVLGVTFTKTFTFLTTVGYSLQILKGCETIALRLASDAAEDVEFIHEVKYKSMRDIGLDDRQIEISKVLDNQVLKAWKDLVIKKIISSYPDSYRSSLLYSDWAGAKKYMREVSK